MIWLAAVAFFLLVTVFVNDEGKACLVGLAVILCLLALF